MLLRSVRDIYHIFSEDLPYCILQYYMNILNIIFCKNFKKSFENDRRLKLKINENVTTKVKLLKENHKNNKRKVTKFVSQWLI